MNLESILSKSKQLTSQMIGIYELSLSGFSSSDLAEMIGVATNLCSSLHGDIQSNAETTEIKSTALKNRKHNQNSFSERLKLALKEQGVTQSVLAESIGISQSTISSMASGKIKNIDTPRAEAIARALDVSFVWLMHGEGSIYGADFLTKVNEV
ncbi:TPA: helix-turn-helix domain-containing protein [Providencia alcalifaciens]